MNRWSRALIAAAGTWLSGWIFTLLSWYCWLMLIGVLVALLKLSHIGGEKSDPMLWAGFPAMCTGFIFSTWRALKNASKTAPHLFDKRAISFKTIATLVLVAQSICYAPCLMQNVGEMFFSEFLLFPLLCAGYSGIVVFQSFSRKPNPGNENEIHPA